MGTFELENTRRGGGFEEVEGATDVVGSARPGLIKTECIIAFKVYDSCRQQDCLTPSIIGPSRAAECKELGGRRIKEGDIIIPPSDAATVRIDDLRLVKVLIVEKEPNPFRPGYWDIDLKYVFKYRLVFYSADGERACSIKANSIFNKKVTLFGSVATDIVVSSDLLGPTSETLDSDPFVLVEGKAVALDARLKYNACDCCDFDGPARAGIGPINEDNSDSVSVTIGLFTIIKLFRLVNLTVESRGFCVPSECEELNPLNPCEFFDSLDFPFNVFSPPQKEDFGVESIADDSIRRRRSCCDED